MNFNNLEVLSCIDNKLKLSYMTRDTCDIPDIAVLYLNVLE